MHGHLVQERLMTRSSGRNPYRVQVIERAVDILQVLADDSRELGAGEVAERLSLHKSTIHRLLMVLDRHRLIRRNCETGKYALGLRLFELGSRAVNGLRLREQAQRYLDHLSRETGETAHICVLDRGDMLSVAHADGPRTLRMPATVGRRSPAYCSAVGKAILAFLPESPIDEVLARYPLHAFTEKTLVTRAALFADLRQVRVRGYAVDNEEIEKGCGALGHPFAIIREMSSPQSVSPVRPSESRGVGFRQSHVRFSPSRANCPPNSATALRRTPNDVHRSFPA
jgi:IclR family transcriptional regulator, KDG regulon repressor